MAKQTSGMPGVASEWVLYKPLDVGRLLKEINGCSARLITLVRVLNNMQIVSPAFKLSPETLIKSIKERNLRTGQAMNKYVILCN
jgi:hypothetical protein